MPNFRQGRARRMAVLAAFAIIVVVVGASVQGAVPSAAATSPIRHVVVIYQENHSYDNVLGLFCRQVAKGIIVRAGSDQTCDGATTGRLPNGSSISLSRAADVGARVGHSVADQTKAIDAGAMDAFSAISGCGPPYYRCYAQYSPSQIPNATAL